MHTILDVEADPQGARTLAAVLAADYRLVHCPDPEKALASLEELSPSAVLLGLGEGLGASPEVELELLARFASRLDRRIPVIAMGTRFSPRQVVRAVRKGAWDFLAKPVEVDELRSILRAAIYRDPCFPFIGSSPATRRASELLALYAKSEYPVLILGESGTGKEVAARGIHELSSRSAGPFVPRNCAAFPEELIESELFGSARGAFTGAVERPGAFELARGGTLFLDEIGDSGPSVQAKLLRVIESGELWRLGDSRERRTDVRLVSATSINLAEAVSQGRFRPELLYRIETLVLELPPLRDRREDIPELAAYFARVAVGERKAFSPGAFALLGGEAWPGNIRQLKNVVHRAIVLSGELEEIREEHIRIY